MRAIEPERMLMPKKKIGIKHIVSYSGGLNSFMVGKRIVDEFGKKNTLLVFTDTKSEDEDLYRFLDETVKYLEAEFVNLADGRDLWQVFNDMNFMSNSRVDNCSQILKRSLFKRWLKKEYKPDECILYMGFDWNETHRLPKVQKRYAPYVVKAPLMDKPYLSKRDISDVLKEIGIEIPRLYKMGFVHNNCGGFCVKTGQAQFKMLLKTMPERYKYHEEQQEKLFERIGQHGFIRMTINGKLNYLSMKQFREYLESNGSIDEFDFGGCDCFV